MKKLLTVIAVVLCACFSMGFTVPTNNNDSPAGILQWKNTMWVNPWVNAKWVTSDNFHSQTDANAGRVPAICRLTYPGGYVELGTKGNLWFEVPTGRPVTFEFQIAKQQFRGQVCAIRDDTTNEDLFQSLDLSVSFQWTPIEGHKYWVYVAY